MVDFAFEINGNKIKRERKKSKWCRSNILAPCYAFGWGQFWSTLCDVLWCDGEVVAAAAAGWFVWTSWVVWRGCWSDEPLVEEEVRLAALDFTFAHRLNTRVTDVEPGASWCLCISLIQSIGWDTGTLWSYFNVGRVVTWPHRSTVLHNAIQTVQNLSLSFSQDLAFNSTIGSEVQ